MITPAFAQLMARYNSEMNRRLYQAAATLPDAQRKQDCKLFFGSLHATLNHLLWADRSWLGRLSGGVVPDVGIPESRGLIDEFAELQRARETEDAKIEAWTADLTDAWLAGDLTYTSRLNNRRRVMPHTLALAHMFNHQTHHRGQAHAALTQAGVATEDTDLPLVWRPS